MRAIKNIALSLIITVIIVLSAFFTREIMPSFWKFFRWGGVDPYIIIFFALWALLDSISNDWKFNRLGLLPGLIGVFGFLLGLLGISAGLADRMCGTGGERLVQYILTDIFCGLSVSLEILLFGFGLTLLLFLISTCVQACQKNLKE